MEGLEKGPEGFPDGFGYDLFAGDIGMDSVTLVEAWDTTNVLEEKGDERQFVPAGKLWEEVAELSGIGVTHIGRYLHAGEDDLCGGVFHSDRVDDGLKVVAGTVEGDSAKPVVTTQLEDEDVYVLPEDPVDTGQAARGGLTADAGVDSLISKVKGIETPANEGGKSLTSFETVACCEAVTKKKYRFCAGV